MGFLRTLLFVPLFGCATHQQPVIQKVEQVSSVHPLEAVVDAAHVAIAQGKAYAIESQSAIKDCRQASDSPTKAYACHVAALSMYGELQEMMATHRLSLKIDCTPEYKASFLRYWDMGTQAIIHKKAMDEYLDLAQKEFAQLPPTRHSVQLTQLRHKSEDLDGELLKVVRKVSTVYRLLNDSQGPCPDMLK